MLRRPRPNNRFVSVLGSLTRHAAANPYDVIHQLTHKTGAEGFIMPVPFIADAVADRQLLMNQKSVGKIIDLAKQAEKLTAQLYAAFVAKDMAMLEINPLVVTKQGQLRVLDAKVSFDDNSLFRHPEVLALRDMTGLRGASQERSEAARRRLEERLDKTCASRAELRATFGDLGASQ